MRNIKRVVSLIICASIFLQVVGPMAGLVTYAATSNNLTWLKKQGLDSKLEPQKSASSSTEAMVSWKLNSEVRLYTLNYYVDINGKTEEIKFAFQDDGSKRATATVKVFDDQGVVQKKYKKYDFSEGKYMDAEPGSKAEITINMDATYPGGAVMIGDIEIRFRWKDGNVDFQSSQIKHGYITPFTLKHGDSGTEKTVEVLTGLEGYKISPIHIEVKDKEITNKEITNKEMVIVPTESGEEPGSKPGVRIDFKRPKILKDKKLGKEFGTITDEEGKKFIGTLDISYSRDIANEKLEFNMGDGEIQGLGKSLVLNQDDTYSLYLAQDDVNNHENIVKVEKLDRSMTLQRVELSVKRNKGGDQALGIFVPQPETEGRYTYLGYTVKRSNMTEALIEIHPYNNIKGTQYSYLVESGTDGSNWSELAKHNHTTTGDSVEKPLQIIIPFSSDSNYYKITVQHETTKMYSQILRYQPKEDATLKPPTPVIKSIDNINVVPQTSGGQPEIIKFDLTWDAPKNDTPDKVLGKLVEEGNIYYELFLHENFESTAGRGVLTKVFKVGPDKDEEISVETHAGTVGDDRQPILRYNASKDEFTMEDIVLKNPKEDGWEQIEIDGNTTSDEYIKGSEYPREEPSLKVTNGMKDNEVPGIYYITMRALYETNQAAITMGVSDISNPKSITISPVKEIIPVPTKIESNNLPDKNDPDVIRQSFSWGNVSIDKYIKQMLDPLGSIVGGEGKGVYEIYLHHKKDIEESELKIISPKATDLHKTKSYTLKPQDIEALRDDQIIRLDYTGLNDIGMNDIAIDGLDANQVYYMTIRLRLDIEHNDGEKEQKHSVLSKRHSFTSYVKPSQPGPGERVPPVPENVKASGEKISSTTVKIEWEAPEYKKQDGEEICYEILRVDSKPLDKEYNNRTLTIKDILDRNSKKNKDKMTTWRKEDLFVEDTGLMPNEIYYYYVRTVLAVGVEEAYSSWVGIPVTTSPIEEPTMLRVEDPKAYGEDPKKVIVVSFLAQIPEGATIPGDYDFDIAVQGEEDDDYDYYEDGKGKKYVAIGPIPTKEDENTPAGYRRYVYKVRNLKPGKRYDIKVSLIDKISGRNEGKYYQSSYTKAVTTRTHFDQDEQDKDDKFEEYLQYFEDKVEALRRKPYWTLEDGANSFSVKYRSNYINPEINSSNAYKLDVREGISNFTYHMPASVIASANLSQTSFEIKQGDVTYSIRPSTITSELEELKATLEDINAKYIRDYYVVFNFSQRSSSTRSGLLTPEISVNMELARLREEDLFIEDTIMAQLNNRINSEKKWFIDGLERALDRGKISDEELEVLMNRSLETIQTSHKSDVRNILNRNTYRVTSISKWNKSMLVMAAIEGNAIAEGYLLGKQDTAITTFSVGGGYGIEIVMAGTYAFKGQKINMPVIPGVGGAGDLIAKYQLTDFFGINGTIDPSKPVSKRNVLGAMARILGAPRGADYIQHLKQINIKGINNIGVDLPIKKGEGTYLLMQVYEKIHKTPINSVYVKNRNVVTNIRSFHQLHQPYVLVAVDSKIIGQDSGIGPNDTMPIKDVLQMLTNITATVK